jgi:hypothetical protein
MDTDWKIIKRWIIGGVALLIGLIVFACWGIPQYRVYSQRMSGKAALAHAEAERQVLVTEAAAKAHAATELARAEVERAKGVAEANRIIGESLKGNEAYLRYLWIQGLNDGNTETIYVPTEAGLPILEANRRQPKVEQ